MALNFDTIASTTLRNYRKQLTDNIFDEHPLLFWLKDKKRVRMLNGGRKIAEPIIHTEGDLATATGSYSGYDAISINPVDTATMAEYDWKQIGATIAISGLEELQNNGEEAIVNLLEAKVMQAEQTLKNALSTMLFSDSTPGNSGKDVTGLGYIIDDTTVVGGIDPADFAGWASFVDDKTAVAPEDVDLRKFVRHAYNTVSKGGSDRVDAVFSGQLLFEAYENELMPTIRRTNTKMADAGFQNLEVQGVPWMWDWEMDDDLIYGINSKYLGLVGHKNRWFKQTKFTEGLSGDLSAVNGGVATTVDARYSVITAALELTCRNRRRHFKITNITVE